jgi:bacterioferritin (cytochrome b1)
VLPKEDYAITILTLDTQPTLSVQDKLTILKNREDVLRTKKATEEALAAKQSAIPLIDSIKCKFCGRKPYTIDKYAF